MLSKNPAQRLRDILENIDAIRAFTARMAFDDFARPKNSLRRDSCLRLPDDLKASNPFIDWLALAAVGNVHRHGMKSWMMRCWHTL